MKNIIITQNLHKKYDEIMMCNSNITSEQRSSQFQSSLLYQSFTYLYNDHVTLQRVIMVGHVLINVLKLNIVTL